MSDIKVNYETEGLNVNVTPERQMNVEFSGDDFTVNINQERPLIVNFGDVSFQGPVGDSAEIWFSSSETLPSGSNPTTDPTNWSQEYPDETVVYFMGILPHGEAEWEIVGFPGTAGAGARLIGFRPPGHDDHSGGENDGEVIIADANGNILSAMPVDVRALSTVIPDDNGLIGTDNARMVFNVSTQVQAGDERPVNSAAVQTALDALPPGHEDIGGLLALETTDHKAIQLGIYDTDGVRIGQQIQIATVDSVVEQQDINVDVSEPTDPVPDGTTTQHIILTMNKSETVAEDDTRLVTSGAVQTALDNLPAGHSDIGGILSISATPDKVAEIGIYDTQAQHIGQQFVISTVNNLNDIQDITINSEPSSGSSTANLAQRLEITLNKATAIVDGELRVPTTQAVLDYVTSIETDPVTSANVRAVLQNDTGVGGISWAIDSGTGDIIGVANIASKADISSTVIDTDINLNDDDEIVSITVGSVTRTIRGNDSVGHIIENSDGTDLPQRPTLQFTHTEEPFSVTDDDINNRTVVNYPENPETVVVGVQPNGDTFLEFAPVDASGGINVGSWHLRTDNTVTNEHTPLTSWDDWITDNAIVYADVGTTQDATIVALADGLGGTRQTASTLFIKGDNGSAEVLAWHEGGGATGDQQFGIAGITRQFGNAPSYGTLTLSLTGEDVVTGGISIHTGQTFAEVESQITNRLRDTDGSPSDTDQAYTTTESDRLLDLKSDINTTVVDGDINLNSSDEIISIRVGTLVRNIAGGGGAAENAVEYVEQSLTGPQQTQARTNINAQVAGDYLTSIPGDVIRDDDFVVTDNEVVSVNIDGTAVPFAGGTGDVTDAEAANSTVWQESFRNHYARAANVIDEDPSKSYTTARDYIKLPTGITSPIVRPSEDTYTNTGLVGTSWVRVPIVGSPWITNREYIVGDQVYTERTGGVTETVICTEQHVSSEDTNPASSEHINYSTNGASSSDKPWRPVTSAITIRTAVTVPDPTPFEGGTGTDLTIVASILGVGVNTGRFGIRLGTDGANPISITDDDLPQVGTTWRFGDTYDVSTPLYTLEEIVQDSATITTFYFAGAIPSSLSLGSDHIWQVITVEEFGQTDTLLFDDEQFNLTQAAGGVTNIAISTPASRFAGRTEFLESLLAPTGATISVSGETVTYTPSGGSPVEIDFDEFLGLVSSDIDQDVNAILIASGYDHGNTIYIDSRDAFFYIAQSGGHFHLLEIADTTVLEAETEAREAADTALRTDLDSEIATRAEDDAIEVVAREAGDAAERDFVETTLHVDAADSQSYYQFSGEPAIFSEVPGTDYGITIAMPQTIEDTEELAQAENIGQTTKVFKLRLRFNDGANDTKEYIVTTGGYNFTISDERTSETFTLPTIEGTYVAASVHQNGTNTQRQNCFLAIGGWHGRIAQVDMAHVLNVSDGSILTGRSLEVGQDYSEHTVADNNNTAIVGLVFDNQTTGSHTGINAYVLQRRNRIVRYRAATSGGLFSFRNGNSVVDRFNRSRVPNVVENIQVDESNWLGLKMVTIQNAISGTAANGDSNRLTYAVGDKMLVAFGEAVNSTSGGTPVPGIATTKNPSTFAGGNVNLGLFYTGGEDPEEEYSNYSVSNEPDFNAHIFDMEYSNASGAWTFFFGGETVGATAIATRAAGFFGESIWNMATVSDATRAGAGGIIRSVNLGGNIAGLATDTHFWITTELGALWVNTTPWLAAGYGDNALVQAHVNPNDPTSDVKRDFTFRGFQYYDEHGSIGAGDDGHIYRLVINPEVTFTVTFGNLTHTASYRFNDDTAAMHAFFANPASYSPTLVNSGVSLITTVPGGEPNDQRYLDFSVDGQNTPVISYQWVGVLSTTDDDFETYSPFRRIDLANTVVDIHYPDGGATYHIPMSSVVGDYTVGGEANGAVDQIVSAVNTHTAQGHSAVRVDSGFADTITNTKPVLRLDQTGTHALQNAPVITIAHPSGQNTGTLAVENFADGGYDTIGRPGGLFDPNDYDTRAELDAKIAAVASTHGYAENIVANAGNSSTTYTRLERLQIGTEIYDVEVDDSQIETVVTGRLDNGSNAATDDDNAYTTTQADRLLTAKQDNLTEGQLAVVDADAFVSADYRTANDQDTIDSGKQDTIDAENAGSIRSTLNVADGADVTPANGIYLDTSSAANNAIPKWNSTSSTWQLGTDEGGGTIPSDFRYALLLTNGFLLPENAQMSTDDRDAYTDTLGVYGDAGDIFWFDNTNDSWFNVATGGTALTRFL